MPEPLGKPAIDLQEWSRALRRMLANGPLTGIPKRPSDQDVLVALAAARFEPGREYREGEVNETLKAWLATFCEPFGIDHVTLRRMLVDARLLARTSSGSTYRLAAGKPGEGAAMASLEPAAVLEDIRRERESRKRERAA